MLGNLKKKKENNDKTILLLIQITKTSCFYPLGRDTLVRVPDLVTPTRSGVIRFESCT